MRGPLRRVAILALAVAGAPSPSAAIDLVWDDSFVDEQVIATGSQVTAGGVDVTLSWTVFSDSDGGTFDLVPQAGNADFLTFEASPLGNHAGLVQLSFDNQNDDPVDYVELTLSFSVPVYGLAFSLLDVDSANGSADWDDGVLLTFNGGINIRSDPSLYTLPAVPAPAITLDDEAGYEGFEAWTNRTALDTQTIGNLDLDFGAVAVTFVTIRYFSTDDAISNPAGQRIGVSDLYWEVPEPGAAALVAIGILGLALAGAPRRL
jgi:hypothetical protein